MVPSGSKIPIGVPGLPTGSLKLAPPLLKNGDVNAARSRELNWFAAGTVCPSSYDVIVRAERSSQFSTVAPAWNAAASAGLLVTSMSPDEAVGSIATRPTRTTPRIHNIRDPLRLGEIMRVPP